MALGERAAPLGAPVERAPGRTRPAIERGAQLAVLQSMARRQERHRVVQRIGRRDQQRIERLKEIEPGSLEQIAPIGQAPRIASSAGT